MSCATATPSLHSVESQGENKRSPGVTQSTPGGCNHSHLEKVSRGTKIVIREDLCGSVSVGLYYKMVEIPVQNRVSSTVHFK